MLVAVAGLLLRKCSQNNSLFLSPSSHSSDSMPLPPPTSSVPFDHPYGYGWLGFHPGSADATVSPALMILHIFFWVSQSVFLLFSMCGIVINHHFFLLLQAVMY
jgi:hypothetical protein